MLTESEIFTLQRTLERVSVSGHRAVESIWRVEGRWAANRVSARLIKSLSDSAGRPGARKIATGSALIKQARRRMEFVGPALLKVFEDFADETYRSTRSAHDLSVTKAGIRIAQTELVGGNIPKTPKQWTRDIMGAWLGSLQDITITAASDGADIEESIRIAETDALARSALIAKKYNSVLLSAGGSPMRVAISEI